MIGLRGKNNSKRADLPNFWNNKFTAEVDNVFKDWIYDQYLSSSELTVYADASYSPEKSLTGVACSYVMNGMVTVKTKMIYTRRDLMKFNQFGELEAILFALEHFDKYKDNSTSVIIYSDQMDALEFLEMENVFNNPLLRKAQKEQHKAFQTYRNKMINNNVSITLLPIEKKKFNPFHRAAHNASKKIATNSLLN